MNEYEIKSFTIYAEYYELIDNLPVNEKKELLIALADYMFKGIEPNLKGMSLAIFNNLKRPLNKSKAQSKRRTKKEPNKNQIKTKKEPNENTSLDVDVDVNVYVNVFDYFSNNIHTITSIECQKLEEWLKVFPEDVVKYAIEICVLNNGRSFKYLEAILKNWQNKGYKNLIDIQEETFNKKTTNEILPNWFDKKDYKETTEEEKKELEELLKEYR